MRLSSVPPSNMQLKTSGPQFGLQHYLFLGPTIVKHHNNPTKNECKPFDPDLIAQTLQALGGPGLHSFTYTDEAGQTKQENIFVGVRDLGLQVITSGPDSALRQVDLSDTVTDIDTAIKETIRSILGPFEKKPGRKYTILDGLYSPSIPQEIADSPKETAKALRQWKKNVSQDGFNLPQPSSASLSASALRNPCHVFGYNAQGQKIHQHVYGGRGHVAGKV